jgi:glycosyltransferase involved in cell wall biosynthesis
VLDSVSDSWEIIFVNDGSTDGSLAVLKNLHDKDERVKVVGFSRNFGNQVAVTAGLNFSQGKAVIVMDSDLQHPPELITEMVRLWREGFHSVYTVRDYGNEIGIVKRTTSKIFSKVMNYFSQLSMPEGLSDFRLLDRKVVNSINSMTENSRFLRAMISWLGFRQTGIKYIANPRFAGNTKFSLPKLITLAIDGITSFSIYPIRWITYCGMLVAMMSMIYAGYILCEVFTTGILTPGWPSLIVAILFLGGIQLMSLGVVGEYIGRIYIETKRRPLFIVQEQFGFEPQETISVSDYFEQRDAA